LFLYFFRLSWTAFGGPLAYMAMMEDDCVEKRRWLSKEEFTEMLGITNMLPGPNATEMAIHIGCVKAGRLGGLLSGLAFTMPSFVIMLVLSWLYFTYGAMPSVAGLFYGMNPVVVAIILVAALRLGKTTILNAKKPSVVDWKLLTLLAAVFLATYLTEMNEALTLLAAGAVGLLIYGPDLKRKALAMAATLSVPVSQAQWTSLGLSSLGQLFLEFLRAGSLLFGTGLVIIPLVGPDVVDLYGWMSYKEFFDGVTLGQVTPGPVVKTSAFVGYKVAGPLGAAVAMTGMFLPPFAIVILMAPVFRRARTNPWLQGFLKGVRAGAVGAILAVALSLGQNAVFDWTTLGIAAVSLVALLRFRVNMSLLVIATGALGVFLKLA